MQYFLLLASSLLPLILASPIQIQRRQADEFGSCSNPTINFGINADRPNENAFAPANPSDFQHGSALNIGVIAGFICQRLQSPCQASQDALSACSDAQSAATGLSGQAAADAFNNAILGGSNGGAAAPAAAAPPAAAADPPAQAAPTPAPAAAGGNFQTFTGTLGGLPPPVVTGGKGFVTDNSDFLNLAAALGRSCDVQHNACANAANSGGGFSVSQCDAQDTSCRALIN